MSTIQTYLDSSVLIAGARGSGGASTSAMEVLKDTTRLFIASDFVRLETLPKVQYFHRVDEAAFYEAYFLHVHVWVPTTPQLLALAQQRASEFGLNGMDALHIAAAELGGADEFITAEKRTKPFFRVTLLRVISISP